MKRSFPSRLFMGALLVLGASASWAPAADHLDGPRLMAFPQGLGNLDINDVYAFQAPNKSNTVLILTLSPAAGVLGPPAFSSMGAYEIKVDNTGDAVEDLTIRFVFSAPNASGRQAFEYSVINQGNSTLTTGTGVTGKDNVTHLGKVRADLFDDPFFFDLNAFNRFKARALAGDPNAASEFLNRGVKNIPQNFFGGFNVLAIVLEVPSASLQSSRKATNIGVWARTLVPLNGVPTQFDRMARPAINTVLIPDRFKDAFNSNTPSQDAIFRDVATVELNTLFGPAGPGRAAANMLLPDVLTFNTADSSGFLNGRRLEDDIVDAELNLLSGGGVKTDNVPNDSVFQTKFPYLGTPNPKHVTIGAMKAALAGQ